MKQSLRLYEEIQSGKDISDEELSLLREEDLEVEDILPKEESKHIVGFQSGIDEYKIIIDDYTDFISMSQEYRHSDLKIAYILSL